MVSDVSAVASAVRRGESLDELPWAESYDELRRIARRTLGRRRSGAALDTTALLHEAYLKVDRSTASVRDRAHFLAVCSTAMRCLLIDEVRRDAAVKRGGELQRATLTTMAHLGDGGPQAPVDILDLDRAMLRLGDASEELVHVVEMKIYGGMTNEEIAEALEVSRSTVKRQWLKARAMLRSLLEDVTSS